MKHILFIVAILMMEVISLFAQTQHDNYVGLGAGIAIPTGKYSQVGHGLYYIFDRSNQNGSALPNASFVLDGAFFISSNISINSTLSLVYNSVNDKQIQKNIEKDGYYSNPNSEKWKNLSIMIGPAFYLSKSTSHMFEVHFLFGQCFAYSPSADIYFSRGNPSLYTHYYEGKGNNVGFEIGTSYIRKITELIAMKIGFDYTQSKVRISQKYLVHDPASWQAITPFHFKQRISYLNMKLGLLYML